MPVRSADMLALLAELNSDEIPWWSLILDRLGEWCWEQHFSEYETYASFCLDRFPGRYASLERPWFRWGHSFFGVNMSKANVASLRGVYDFVAFEEWDRPTILRRLRAFAAMIVDFLKWKLKGAANYRLSDLISP